MVVSQGCSRQRRMVESHYRDLENHAGVEWLMDIIGCQLQRDQVLVKAVHDMENVCILRRVFTIPSSKLRDIAVASRGTERLENITTNPRRLSEVEKHFAAYDLQVM